MQIKSVQKQIQKGFTLIEMIGVLAVIAILLALLVPKIFEAINSARVNNAAGSCNTIKTAIMDHYGKYGAVGLNGAAFTPYPTYDTSVLLTEGLIDKPFAVRIGDSSSGASGTRIEVVAAASSLAVGAITPGATPPVYSLDGNATNNVAGTWVAQAVISGVDMADAQALSERLDGRNLSQAVGTTTADITGRVEYAAKDANGTTTVYVYLAHR